VPAQVVEDIGATRLEDALDYAGGVERGNNFGGQGLTEFLVRGFSTQEFYRNGFAVNRGYPNMPDANTLERIEVLRGPASMLYGRGDPGGTFNIVSKQPQAERRTVLGSQVNTDGLRRGTLDTTGALDESAAFTYRLNLVAEGSDSFRDHVESERYNIAPVLRWQLNDDTALILEGDYLHNRHPLDRGLTRYPNQAGRNCAWSTSWTASGCCAAASSTSTAAWTAARWKTMAWPPMAARSGATTASAG